MAENQAENGDLARIYEVGYHIVPTAKDEDVEKIVSGMRAHIEKAGGSLIAEGAPSLIKLAFPMTVRDTDKKTEYDRAHFGWLKFEAVSDTARSLEETLVKSSSIVRCIVFTTVREDTRAKMKAPQLREVKRTDTIKSTPRRAQTEEGGKPPVSEEQLDKALETLTAES